MAKILCFNFEVSEACMESPKKSRKGMMAHQMESLNKLQVNYSGLSDRTLWT